MKTVECSRCKGKGIGNWVVSHLGVPGLCFKCDGTGKVAKLTMEERITLFIAEKEKHLRELETEAENVKQAYLNGRQTAFQLKRRDETLERYRETYRQVLGAIRKVREVGKLTATEYPASLPCSSPSLRKLSPEAT